MSNGKRVTVYTDRLLLVNDTDKLTLEAGGFIILQNAQIIPLTGTLNYVEHRSNLEEIDLQSELDYIEWQSNAEKV